jgi:TonB family protein
VRDPHVVESNNPAFERPALDAVLKWKFKPAVKNGHAVNTRAAQEIRFELFGGGDLPWQINKPKKPETLPPELRWDKAPVPVSTAFPVFPFAALQAETKGRTKVSFLIGPEGLVREARVLEATTPEMGQAVLATMDVWRFKPAQKKDGTPSLAAVAIEHEFDPFGRGDVSVTPSALRILGNLAHRPADIIPLAELDQPPKPLSRRPPVYPSTLEAASQAGQAMIEFFIDEKGDAQLPRIVSSTAPEFGYAAVQAVAAWRYEPPQKNKQPVVARVQIPVVFFVDPARNPGPTPGG